MRLKRMPKIKELRRLHFSGDPITEYCSMPRSTFWERESGLITKKARLTIGWKRGHDVIGFSQLLAILPICAFLVTCYRIVEIFNSCNNSPRSTSDNQNDSSINHAKLEAFSWKLILEKSAFINWLEKGFPQRPAIIPKSPEILNMSNLLKLQQLFFRCVIFPERPLKPFPFAHF